MNICQKSLNLVSLQHFVTHTEKLVFHLEGKIEYFESLKLGIPAAELRDVLQEYKNNLRLAKIELSKD
jgi:hypothetical protein